jgi:predicted transcriptional regulator
MKRGLTELLFRVLQVIDLGEHVFTRAMYASNTECESFNKLLNILLMRELISLRFEGIHKRLYITVKGIELLNHWLIINQTLRMEEVIDLNIKSLPIIPR